MAAALVRGYALEVNDSGLLARAAENSWVARAILFSSARAIMATSQDKSGNQSDEPGFFDMPRGVRLWAEAGRRFWFGALFGFLIGIGFGMVTGAAMVLEWGFITAENDGVLGGIALLLLITSMFFAQWAVLGRPREGA
jgi:hypothetical protein